MTLSRKILVGQAAVHVHKTLGRPAFFPRPPLAEAQHEQCERKRDDRPGERVEGRLGSAEQGRRVIGSSRPSVNVITPETRSVRRRTVRTCVERCRCARLRNAANAAASRASGRTVSAAPTYAVRTGKAPQASANQRSEWKRPPKSSRLYATTMNVPKTTNGSSNGVHAKAAARPMAAAPPIDAVASATRTRLGIAVRSGRPLSSSSACAPTPSARKNAARPQSSRWTGRVGASAAPIDDIGQMPERVGRVEQGDVVAPAAGLERVERRALLDFHFPRPHMTTPPPKLRRRKRTSVMPASAPDLCELLGRRQRTDARAEEAAHVVPARRDHAAGEREGESNIELPECAPERRGRDPNSSEAIVPPLRVTRTSSRIVAPGSST